jgi:hypothetical protein
MLKNCHCSDLRSSPSPLNGVRGGQSRKPPVIIGKLYYCAVLMALAVLFSSCGGHDAAKDEVARLAKEKEKQAKALNAQQSRRWPHEATKYFNAVEAGNWKEANNIYQDLDKKYGQMPAPVTTNLLDKIMMNTYALGSHVGLTPRNYWPQLGNTPAGTPLNEMVGVCNVYERWDRDLLLLFGTNILASIPPHSVYFGGSAPGRFIITALSKSQSDGDPFFTLTQNALADPSYRKYTELMYGKKLHLPNDQDSSQAFQDYMKEATERLNAGKLKPGENISNSGGRVSVSGMVAVMEINGILVKQIFDQNPDREFYIEESWPLDWMYPHLVPHGLIMKVNRQPLATLDQGVVDVDRAYWGGMIEQLLGRKIDEGTSLPEIIDYEEAILLKRDLSGFKGNVRFMGNPRVQDTFAHCRIAIAGIYAWRAKNGDDAADRQRMAQEADLAFRQAFALCPRLDRLSDYAEFLHDQNRAAEEKLLKEAQAKFGR